MLQSELDANRWKTYYHYAKLNNYTLTHDSIIFKTEQNTYDIINWTFPIPKPTEEQLLSYNLADVNNTFTIKQKNDWKTNNTRMMNILKDIFTRIFTLEGTPKTEAEIEQHIVDLCYCN